jgi:hypothetical protein
VSSSKETKTEYDMLQSKQLQINGFLNGVTEERGPLDILMYLCAQMNRLPIFSTVMEVDYKRRLRTVQTSAPLKRKGTCKSQGPSPGQTNDCSECQFLLSVSTLTVTLSHAKQTAFN